jgi:SAM-dependent methyltransferase
VTDLPEHVRRNRASWDRAAAGYEASGHDRWASDEPYWGIFDLPESQVGLLPDDVAGLDVIELGCGTAYVSAWLARRGARPVGIDNSQAQLANARRFQEEFGLTFPLHHGNAEAVPFPDASFDLAISEYGASIWCDPYAWIPEAARLVRPGGRLIFLVNGLLAMLCVPDDPQDADAPVTDRLLRPSFGLHSIEWSDDDSVEFHLPHGELIALLRSSGFEIESLSELQPPENTTASVGWMPLEWARQWPCEEVWKVRRQG